MELFNDTEKTAYYVSAFGEVWSLRKSNGRWRELKPKKGHDGYLRFSIWQNGVGKTTYVHRAVYEAFNGPIPEGLEINHINTRRDDCRLSNRELVTPAGTHNHPPTRENMREAKRPKMKRVLDATTGIEYESINEAARQTRLDIRHISACCNEKRNSVGGHSFRYATEAA